MVEPYEGTADYVFVSYCHGDKELVLEDIEALQKAGVRIWFDRGLHAGEGWFESQVAPRILNERCRAILVFLSPEAMVSSGVLKEFDLIASLKGKTPIIPINLAPSAQAASFSSLMKSAFTLDGTFFEKISTIFHCFCGEKAQIDETLFIWQKNEIGNVNTEEIIRQFKIQAPSVISRKSSEEGYAIAVLAKDSPFSRSIVSGIRYELSNYSDVNVSEHLFRGNNSEVQWQTTTFLERSRYQFDAFMIRPSGTIDSRLFSLLCEIAQDNREVVLIDIGLDQDQKRKEGAGLIHFVGSDFALGGRSLAEELCKSIALHRRSQALVLVCDLQSKRLTDAIRTSAFIQGLAEAGIEYRRIVPDSLETSTICRQFTAQVRLWIDRGQLDLCGRDLFLYASNDTVAIELTRSKSTYGLLDLLEGTASVCMIGYDGLRDSSLEYYSLELSHLPFLTVDVDPFQQGVSAAGYTYNILEGLTMENELLVAPCVVNTLEPGGNKSALPANIIRYLDKHNDLFLFDVDGTLAETEPLHWEAYNAILSRQNIELQHEDILRYIGNPETAIYDMIRADYGADIDDEVFLEERLAHFLDLVILHDLNPFDYVLPLIEHYPDVPKALVTSQRPEIVDTLIKKWGLESSFPQDARLSCSAGTFSKSDVYSDPWKYLPQLGSGSSESVVVFEDASHAIKAAEQAGVGTVGIRNSMNRESYLGHTVLDVVPVKGVFVGLCGRDIVYYANAALPEENKKARISDFRCDVGGPAANAALTFAKLGGASTLVTCLGSSTEAKAIKNQLHNEGVYVIDLAEGTPNMPNISAIYINESNGSRTIFSGQTPLDAIQTPTLKSVFEDALFCLYDCNLNNIVEPMIQDIISCDIPLVMDCGAYKEKTELFLNVATDVISSESFIDITTGAKGYELLGRYPLIRAAATTRGEKTIIYRSGEGAGEIAPPHVDHPVDTLGAGDVFHGAYCYFRFVLELDFVESLRRASIIASQSVCEKGALNGISELDCLLAI